MPINFPDAPNLNDTHTVGDNTWIWDGSVWLGVINSATLLATLQTVDGASSGLDADLFDGLEATAFATSAQGALADTAVQPQGTLYVDGGNTRVGIGTPTPAVALDVVGVVAATGTPTASTHLVPKSYVDAAISGLTWHESARLATSGVLPDSPTYSNGASGVGATLTAGSLTRLNVDGANANTGDRVLVKNQANAAHNGIYDVTQQGLAATTAWVLTRSTDFDGSDPEGVQPGEAVFVLAGATNVRHGFVVASTPSPHTIGVDNITFTQFTGTQAFTAGNGISSSGNTLNVGTASATRIVVNADDIDLATVATGSTGGANTSDFVSALTVDAYGRVTNVETSNVGQALQTTSNVTFNSVVASLTGNASTASALQTPRTIQISGDVTGSAAFDGSSPINIAATIPSGSVSLSEMADVIFGTPQDRDVLIHNGATWVDSPLVINDVSDVTISGVSTGQVLRWSGAAWANFDILASAALTGTPTAPTASPGTNNTQIASTGFVTAAVNALVDAAPGTLDTLNELAAALGDDPNFATTITNSLALKAPLASPTFTGTVSLPAGTEIRHAWSAVGASRNLALADAGASLDVTAVSTLTVPPNSTTAFPIGTTITVFQTGTGTCTIAPGAGVTITGAVGLKTREQYSAIVLHKRATDTWILTGDAKA